MKARHGGCFAGTGWAVDNREVFGCQGKLDGGLLGRVETGRELHGLGGAEAGGTTQVFARIDPGEDQVAELADASAGVPNGGQGGPFPVAGDFIGGQVEFKDVPVGPVFEGDLDRADIAATDDAIEHTAFFGGHHRNHDWGANLESVPGELQGAVAFDEGKQIPPSEPHAMVFEGEIKEGGTGLFGGRAGTGGPTCGKLGGFGGGIPVDPPEESIEVRFASDGKLSS
jgi:hypothetical protein